VNDELFGLIRQAKLGDNEAFSKIVSRYSSQVYRQAFAMLGERMEAEDVSQEAFLKAYKGLQKLESEYAFVSWMTQIVFRLCYDRLQKRKKQAELLVEQNDAYTSDRGEQIQRKQMQLSIQEAMAHLSPEQREIIILKDVQGFAYDEIANLLQIAVGTVKSRVHAARLKLKKELQRKEESD
jgi:RNA polymerase sigma factor (sigma-70 family)